jgi:hypothetical protein
MLGDLGAQPLRSTMGLLYLEVSYEKKFWNFADMRVCPPRGSDHDRREI